VLLKMELKALQLVLKWDNWKDGHMAVWKEVKWESLMVGSVRMMVETRVHQKVVRSVDYLDKMSVEHLADS
jgi:hypothetical protein